MRSWLTADIAKGRKSTARNFCRYGLGDARIRGRLKPSSVFLLRCRALLNLGSSYFKSGSFSLYDFGHFVGYSLPLILVSIRFVAKAIHIEESRLFHVINAVITAGALVYVIPNLKKWSFL